MTFDPKRVAVLTGRFMSDGAPVSVDVSLDMLRRFAEDAPPEPGLYGASACFYDSARQAVPALTAEVESLRDRYETQRSSNLAYFRRAEASDAEAAKLRAVLREVEWGSVEHNGPDAGRYCPTCGEEEPGPHAPGCRLAAALGV